MRRLVAAQLHAEPRAARRLPQTTAQLAGLIAGDLGQTGLHIGAREVARLRAAWDRDEARLRERIAAIRARLDGPSAS